MYSINKNLFYTLKRIFIIPWFLIILLFSQPATSQAEEITTIMPPTAAFYLLPDYNLFFDPNYLYIDIIADPAVTAINAAQIKLNFDSAFLNLEEVNYSDSFCKFLLATTTDNITGIFSMSCGTTQLNYNSSFALARLKFSKLQAGWANLLLSDSAMLASDGTGLKIGATEEAHNIMIIK